jgi:hypothetical protein
MTEASGGSAGGVPQNETCAGSGTGDSGMDFIAPTAQVAVLPGQGIVASATTGLGGLGGAAASNLSLNVCYREVTDAGPGLLVSDGNFLGSFGVQPISVGAGTSLPMSLTRSFSGLVLNVPVDGVAYEVGLCGCVHTLTDQWSIDWSALTVSVVSEAL